MSQPEKCEQCGCIIPVHAGKPRRFCSAACRQKWWYLHPDQMNKKAYYTQTCKYCGKEFTAYGTNKKTILLAGLLY